MNVRCITILISYFEGYDLITLSISSIEFSVSLRVVEPGRIAIVCFGRSCQDIPIICPIHVISGISEWRSFIQAKKVLNLSGGRIDAHHITINFVFGEGESFPHEKWLFI